MKAAYKIVLSAVILSGVVCHAPAQTALDVFGKNRIQYKQFEWKMVSTTNFEVYFYQEGTELAYMAARHAESDFDRIADLLGYTPYAKTKLFIYNSIADLQQSNVGLSNDATVIGGQTSFVKSRVEIPYPGSAAQFRREISLGISRMFITEMMFGGSLKDMVQSSYLLSLPEWFVSGAAAYVAEGWGAEMDDFVRDMIVHKNVRKPAVLTGEEATLVGQSIWNYIAERYGRANVSNILNLTRIIRNEESSIVSTLGVYPYSSFLKEWRGFYTNMNAPVINAYSLPAHDLRTRRNSRNRFTYSQVRLSPDGQWMAYSEGLHGRYKVYAHNVRTGQRKTLMAGGYRTLGQQFDDQVPVLGWRNRSQVVVAHVRQGEYALSIYDLERPFYNRLANRKTLKSFMQVADFDVAADGKSLIMSAVRNGKSDIFLYDIGRGAVTPVTEDFYDDLHPRFMGESGRAFVFSSNRTSDSLKPARRTNPPLSDHFDLFLHDPARTGEALQRIAASPGNETQPVVRGQNIFFLNDLTGIAQLYRYSLASRSVQPVSGLRQSLRWYDIGSADSSLAYHLLDDRRTFVGYSRRFDFAAPGQLIQTKRSELLVDRLDLAKVTPPASDAKAAPAASGREQLVLEDGEVDTDSYEFDADIRRQTPAPADQTRSIAATVGESASRNRPAIQINGPSGYQRRFTTDNAVTSFQIDPVRGLGITFDAVMNEVLEDHKLKGGLTGFFDLASSNFYGEYQYLKHRVDFGVRYDKRTFFFGRAFSESYTQRYNLHRVQFTAAYPLSVSSRVSVAPTFMFTRFVEARYNTGSAPPIATTAYAGARAEYVFDNTTINGLNMAEGTRIRLRYERYDGVSESSDGISAASRSFQNIAADFRHYQKVHRDLILATRLAYGRFGGRAPKQYLLGGMDNWAFNEKDARPENDPLLIAQGRDNRDILFNEFATNLRGFAFNKLSGNSFLLLNAELRLPLIKYFYRGPITSNFFKNLQFAGFTDIGTAWTGASPFSRQNSLNTTTIDKPPFTAVVTNFKNPFLIGYGAGARTLLFGYYFKFDVAWGVEDFVVNPVPRYYLTLGYDF